MHKEASAFDLNIERILEGWDVHHALREVIANALDEQALTNTREIVIAKDAGGGWHVRDYGRGLRYGHLTQNENKEKLNNSSKVVGKFGVGLKDALATLHRRRVDVAIKSKYGDITLNVAPKHGFTDVKTLHALIAPPRDAHYLGTDFFFQNVKDSQVDAAKSFFLKFSGESVIDSTGYGQILRRAPAGKARIYVKGLLVAEEENFAFSYNITSLTAQMNRALNRERTNVGRTAYADRVKAVLLGSTSGDVAEKLAEDLTLMEQGTSHDEVKSWTDVAVHACQTLNASKKVVFVSAGQRTLSSDAIDHAIKDGHRVVTVPENVRDRLHGIKDIQGNPVRDLAQFEQEFAASFEFKFIEEGKLSTAERRVFDLHAEISDLVGGLPRQVKEIKISETMRPDFSSRRDALGLWEPRNRRIIIKRSELRSLEAFAATLLHEMTHASTDSSDVTREFEDGLTAALGKAAALAVTRSG